MNHPKKKHEKKRNPISNFLCVFFFLGCYLSFPGNKLISGEHCKIRKDEISGLVWLEDIRCCMLNIHPSVTISSNAISYAAVGVSYLYVPVVRPEYLFIISSKLNKANGMMNDY